MVKRGASLSPYGFEEQTQGVWVRAIPNDTFDCDEIALVVSKHVLPENRLILSVVLDEAESLDIIADLDVLYDMIKDGVIEKRIPQKEEQ